VRGVGEPALCLKSERYYNGDGTEVGEKVPWPRAKRGGEGGKKELRYVARDYTCCEKLPSSTGKNLQRGVCGQEGGLGSPSGGREKSL